MTLEFAPYRAHHLSQLELQEAQAAWDGFLEDHPATAEHIQVPGMAWTLLIGGRAVGCAGVIPVFGHMARAWCFIGRDMPRQAWVAAHNRVRAALQLAVLDGFWRVETQVRTDFPAGQRWARLLGFRYEGTMQGAGIDAGDVDLYARIRRREG